MEEDMQKLGQAILATNHTINAMLDTQLELIKVLSETRAQMALMKVEIQEMEKVIRELYQ